MPADGEPVPGSANAKSIEVTTLKALHHEGRRQHDESRPRPGRLRPPASRAGAGNGGLKTGTTCRRLAAPGHSLRRVPDDACSEPRSYRRICKIPIAGLSQHGMQPGETVMALPFNAQRQRRNGIGTLTWPSPRLDAMATGAIMCAASKQPRLSLSRMLATTPRGPDRDQALVAANPSFERRRTGRGVGERDEADPERYPCCSLE